MQQGLKVLRGCFTAYLAGVVAISLGNALTSARGVEAAGAVAIFGLFAMIPFTLVALGIWYALARRDTSVTAPRAVLICGAVFAVFGALLGFGGDGLLVGLMASGGAFLVGGLFGIAFWVGAFGLAKTVTLTRSNP